MKFELLTPALVELDQSAGDLLALPVFNVGAPPHGLSGLVDWRLHGAISRLLADRGPGLDEELSVEAGSFKAEAGERLLLPAGRKVPFDWVLFYGLGPPKGYGMERYRTAADGLVRAVTGLKVRRVGMVLPAWREAGVTARASVEILLRGLWARKVGIKEPLDELMVIEEMDAHMDISESAHNFLTRIAPSVS
ncbi:MAG: M17 family peptidase N-terminal domain-containing protein [Pseudomonadota bacterium]